MLPYALLEACVKAWPKRPEVAKGACDAGFDVAEGGGNKCSVVIRLGPVVLDRVTWPGEAGDLDPAARRAHAAVRARRLHRMYYDGASAMKGPLRRAYQEDPGLTRYGVRAELFGGEVRGPRKLYDHHTTNAQMFSSRNMQMAQNLRIRAQNTYRLLRGEEIDPHKCLFIDPGMARLNQFLDQCALPIRKRAGGVGQWILDKSGGTDQSPDDFDGLSLAFARDSESGLKAR